MVSLSSLDLHTAWWPSAVGSVVEDIPSVNREGFYSVFVLSLFALFFFLLCIHQTFFNAVFSPERYWWGLRYQEVGRWSYT